MKIENIRSSSSIFYLVFASILVLTGYLVIKLNNLSLWGDELWLLFFINFDYVDLLKPGFLEDPNYPASIIFFKSVSDLLNLTDPYNLVWVNLLNMSAIIFSAYLIRKLFLFQELILFLSLIFCSEFFIRTFFELKSGGLILGLASIFSAFFLINFFSKGEKGLYPALIIGSVLSLTHALSGLFVTFCYFLMYFNIKDKRKYWLIFFFFIPLVIVLLFSNREINDFHLALSFKHIVNTGGFMVPVVLLIILSLFQGFSDNFRLLSQNISLILPVIFSLIIIFLYSYFVMPIFQARYLITFLPLICIYFLICNKHNFEKNKLFLIIICFLSALLFYGPRSSVPYTNFEHLITESHKEACQEEPIFFNNTRSGVNKYYKKVYETASVIYAPEFQRKLVPYTEVLDTFNFNSKCDVIGISGQGPETVFKNQLSKDINIESLEINSRLANGCNKSGCGVIWYIKQLSLD